MNKQGYTLLEVSLFLSITGVLALVAIVGLAPRLRNVRFSTTMRDLQSNIAKQLTTSARGYSSSASRLSCSTTPTGLSVASGSASTINPCVYAGKVALLGESDGAGGQRVEYHAIVASLNPLAGGSCSTTYEKSSFEYIKYCSQARLLDSSGTVQTFDYTNQLTQPGSSKYGFGFVRAVDTDTVHNFVFTYSGDVGDSMLSDVALAYADTQQVCYQMSNRRAVLELSKQYTSPKLLFNLGSC